MNPVKQKYQNQANTIISALEKRNMKGYYFNTSEDAVSFIQTFIQAESSVSWGGSMTLHESGIIDALNAMDLKRLDRDQASTPAERHEIARDALRANVFLTSTNAITLDGKLVNIDGNGNRVAALIFGPDQVLVVAGMNKVAVDEKTAVLRVQNIASPANTVRLKQNTPCAKTGKCHHCLVDDCICSHTVITRRSNRPDRIHVILIGEELGY